MDFSIQHPERSRAPVVIAAVLALFFLIPAAGAMDVPPVGESGAVSPYQALMNDAASNHNAAIQNMQKCSYNAALQNADRITSDGNSIYSAWGQQAQGRILLDDANNIRSAVSGLRNGQAVTFYDIVNNRNVRISPCGPVNPTPVVTPTSMVTGSAPSPMIPGLSYEDEGLIGGILILLVAVGFVVMLAAKAGRSRRGRTQGAQPGRRRHGPGRIPALRRQPAGYSHAPVPGPGAGPYESPPSAPGPDEYGVPPSVPTAAGGHPLEDMGVISHTPPLHPAVSSLQVARVGNFVRMDWTEPPFDPAKEQLIGYDVSRGEPVPWSTKLERVFLGQVDPGVHSFTAPYLDGALYYNVRPIYRTFEGLIVFGPAF